jgi:hypothetical protein
MQSGYFPVESGRSVALAIHPRLAQLLENEYTYSSLALSHLGLSGLNVPYLLFIFLLNVYAIYLKEISLSWKKSSHHN